MEVLWYAGILQENTRDISRAMLALYERGRIV